MENKNHDKNSVLKHFGSLMVAGGLLIGATNAVAAPVDAGNMTINGSKLSTLIDGNGQVPIDAGLTQKLRYTGYGQSCSDVEWYIKLDGATVWRNFDHTKYAEQLIHRPGNHQLKLTVEGYNNWFTFCFHKGEYSEKTIELKVDTPSYTQTKHPIMVVPGVLAYDSINVLIDRIDYFYGVADELEKTSDHNVHTFSLNPWQDTVDRGEDLAAKIIEQVALSQTAANNPNNYEYQVPFNKVNLLAHSHGSTTSRVAIKTLKDQGLDYVASLTTVAGPHFGTPTADGAMHGLENWDFWGPVLENTLIPMFHGVGCILATLAGDSQYCGDMSLMDVLVDFTQEGMYEFNNVYASHGVPTGGKYYLEGIDPAEQVNNFYDAYGRGLYDDWYAQTNREYDVVQADGSVETQALVIGDGYGNEAHIDDADAVQYYSFSGDAPSNSMPNATPLSDDTVLDNVLCVGSDMPTDVLMDSVLCVFNSFYGAMYWNHMNVPEESDFPAGSPEWIPHDGFIPVDSAKFGKYLGTHYWNHVDEQNQFLGLIPSEDPQGNAVSSPIEVYRDHANRLQRAGL
jgi:triacylglycerol esterase/lipase EstA (alpha/beta hydrolase family)